MSQPKFIGRNNEITLLNDLLNKKTSSLVVIRGRRRIGKSRLIEEYAKKMTFYQFSGLAPSPNMTAQDQRNEFALQLSQQTGTPELQVDDWSKLLLLLADKCKTGRAIILFDEITWMAHGDPTFLSKLKNAWDIHFKKNSKLILVLCGSVSAWIEKNIISSTGYFGRISLDLTLSELSIIDCNQLLKSLGFHRSETEKLILLSLTGGVPWYIEQINSHYSSVDNIKNLCFKKNSLLVKEYKHIFHDLFGNRSQIYQKIITLLASADCDYDTLSEKLEYAKSSALSAYLDELILSGYISQYTSWMFKTGRQSTKLKKYRLSDNFLRFYFRYMKNKINAINDGNYANVAVSSLPGWQSMLGLQFENLVLKNRELIHQSLSINPADIISSGPYFQRKTLRKQGCQIDYLIQTKYNTLFVCEIKFSQNSIGSEIIEKVKEKIVRLSLPRGFAAIPILIHTSEITEALDSADYFLKIINFSDYLKD
jgi:AAA+ ATPase superfamily predicted ATPase